MVLVARKHARVGSPDRASDILVLNREDSQMAIVERCVESAVRVLRCLVGSACRAAKQLPVGRGNRVDSGFMKVATEQEIDGSVKFRLDVGDLGWAEPVEGMVNQREIQFSFVYFQFVNRVLQAAASDPELVYI